MPLHGKKELLLYGKITKRHGLSGEVKVLPFGGRPDTLSDVGKIYVEVPDEESPREFSVSRKKIRGNAAVLKLRGVDTPEAADGLRNMKVLVERSDLQSPGEDEYYWFDLIGLGVRAVSGETLGKVTDLIAGAGHDILVVKSVEGDREFLVPFAGKFVAEVDTRESVVTVEPVEGLFD